jgi:predicted ABC-type transport system involved in lysophospholipase L1 biosynthesis ATPase subunit
VAALGDAGRAQLRASRIGVVLQRDNLIPFLSACENVELAITIAGGRRARARARELLSELGLGQRLHHRPSALSGGESQRVAVAVALANEPDLLLADEVTGELDSTTAEQVMGVIHEAWRERGLSVLYVTHSDELAARAEHRLGLSDGAVHLR